MTSILLILGLILLAACGIISPLVIGLIVVGYGTSAPELAVDVKARSSESRFEVFSNLRAGL
jgi:Ca2+/Na+ antiporter